MKKNKELKDDWRYSYVGEDDWIIESFFAYDPEDEIIDALDKEEVKELSLALTSKEEDLNEELHKALDKVPERYRNLIWDYYFDGKSYSQIGEDNGYSKQYAFQEVQKALELLKEIML